MSSLQPTPTQFKCLVFDCFGTLVDWETGIYQALAPLYTQLPPSHPLRHDRVSLLGAFTRNEGIVQSKNPKALYRDVLQEAYGRLADELGVASSLTERTDFGLGVSSWPVFTDTVDALSRLQKHFKLVILSNVDNQNFQKTIANHFRGVVFNAIYTAEDIGSYKPDLTNFNYLIEHCAKDLGVKKREIIHTAQSLPHDLVPAHSAGLQSAWIERSANGPSGMGGNLEEYANDVSFSWRFRDMKEMADAVDKITMCEEDPSE